VPDTGAGPSAYRATGSPLARAIDMGQTTVSARRGVDALFRAHHGDLVRLALLLVGDRASAEDVVQDVYLGVYKRWQSISARDAVLPYVRTAVLNGCRSVLRRRTIALRAGLKQRAAHADEALASAEHEVILSEDRRHVLAALAALPPRRREVLVLRYYLGLSEAEIAEVLGISPGTVKSTAARALAALARELGEDS
jgi:RNA polymerase sigma-70 factor (sigma-E family)